MDETHGSRMVSFGAIMIMLAGTFNVLDGIVALVNASYFSESLLFAEVETWGWFFAIYGVIQVFVGVAVFSGSHLARWLAIVVAGLNALTQLAYVSHYPAWSITIIVVDVIVIYAFATYGTAFDEDMAHDERPHEALSPTQMRAAGPRAL
jgi:hypothetical protein